MGLDTNINNKIEKSFLKKIFPQISIKFQIRNKNTLNNLSVKQYVLQSEKLNVGRFFFIIFCVYPKNTWFV